MYSGIDMIHCNIFGRFYKILIEFIFVRGINLLILCYLASNLLIACTPYPPKEVTLRFFVQKGEVDFWTPRIKEFEFRNPNIKIKLPNFKSSHTDDLLKEFVSDCKKDSQPHYDLVLIDVIWLKDLIVEDKCLQPIEESKFPDLKNDYLKNEVENGKIKGELYRIPFATDAGVLFYRRDILESEEFKNKYPSGIETFDDLLDVSQKVQKERRIKYGYVWQGQHYEGLSAMFVEVLQGYGGFWIRGNDVGLNRPEAINAVEFLKNTIDKGISPSKKEIIDYDENRARDKFLNGEAVFMRNWPGTWVDLNKSTSKVRGKVGIQAMVHAHARGKTSASTIGGWGIGISAHSNYPKEAAKVIQFFTSTEIQRKFAFKAGFPPTRKNLFYDPEIVNQYNYLPELKKIIEEYGTNRPQITQYRTASEILQDCLSQAMIGEMQVSEAMNIAQTETEKLLQSKGEYNKNALCGWKKRS